MKVSEGKLQYDIPNLVKDKPVDNAFDVIGELPGIQKDGDKVSIIGTPSTSILINGRKSSMTAEQLAGLLKSTSSSKVKQIDVMYSTPPRFGVKGASINVVIENDKSLKDVLKVISFLHPVRRTFRISGRITRLISLIRPLMIMDARKRK